MNTITTGYTENLTDPSRRHKPTGAAVAVAAVLAAVAGGGVATAGDVGDELPVVSVERITDGADGDSFPVQVGADGSFVVFTSRASNLVPGDTNGVSDLFLHDLVTGETERIGLTETGAEPSAAVEGYVSEDRSVAVLRSDGPLIAGDTDGISDVYLRDLITGDVTLVSSAFQGHDADGFFGTSPSQNQISADGSRIVFLSSSPGFVPGDTNGKSDVFVFDRTDGSFERVSVATDGSQSDRAAYSSGISADGSAVVFTHEDSRLVSGFSSSGASSYAYVRYLATGELVLVSRIGTNAWLGSRPFASADGSVVIHERPRPGGDPGDTQVYDRNDNEFSWLTNERVSGRSGTSVVTDLSGDGRFVAFGSGSSDEVPEGVIGYFQLLYDRWTSEIYLISQRPDGEIANVGSFGTRMSRNASVVAYASNATNLVAGDTGGHDHIYVATTRLADRCRGLTPTIVGSGAIRGTNGDDVILGSNGPDVINALAGNDVVCAGGGDDVVYGRAGDDLIYGGPGADTIYGNIDNDELHGNTGPDKLVGLGGTDTIIGGQHTDILRGGFRDDILDGLTDSYADRDILIGGAANDTCLNDQTTDEIAFCEG